MFAPELMEKASALYETCRTRGLRLATAESCTGGLIAACLTEIAGVSEIYLGGFVTYANEVKTAALGVDAGLIEAHGAVSAEVARAMAEGALARTGADVSVSVTGVAGPGGGTPEKPVGLVHLGAGRRGGETLHSRHRFSGGREAVRAAAVAAALDLALEAARS